MERYARKLKVSKSRLAAELILKGLEKIEDDSRRSPSSRRRGRREMSLSQASRQVSKFERLIERIKEVESELDELADMAEKMRNMLKTLLEVRE